jgi:cytochrome c oxidase subunit IV
MAETEAHAHIIPYRTFIRVWLLLLSLTAFLVITSVLFQSLSVWAMLFITPVKAGLVFFFFMHLKYEKPYLRVLVLLTLGLLTMFIGIMYFDVLYR